MKVNKNYTLQPINYIDLQSLVAKFNDCVSFK